MAGNSRPFFKSGLFWIAFISFLLAAVFVLWGEHIHEGYFVAFLKRLWYGTVFFLGVIIVELLYLFLTKEEEREKRRLNREARREARKEERRHRREKKKAIKRLKQTFYKAIKTVKQSSMYSRKSSYNYEIPWYLVIGGSSSAQKDLLKSSGLDFPTNIDYREDQNDADSLFQWFFSEDGVFVTIPKAYVNLDRSSSSHPVWMTFLKLFKKERWRRPVNGIIFTIDASEIEEGSTELHEYAKVVREKLNEISSAFSSSIPVYMIVTNVDSVPAFDKFFSNLTLEEKREILGVTFEDEVDELSEGVIEAKFSDLMRKLEFETIPNLQSSWDDSERRSLFFFMDRFHDFVARTNLFAEKAFGETRYYSSLLLRGIYFTDLGRSGKNSHAVTVKKSALSTGMFIPKVFEQIILSETQLVKVNDTYHKKFAILWSIALGLLVLFFSGIIYYWSQFIKSEDREAKVIEDTYAQYKDLQKVPKPKLILKRKAKKPSRSIEIGKLGGKNGGDVGFGRGNAHLTPMAKKELSKLAKHIAGLDESTRIKIVGHTDSIGDEDYNMKLSKARADSVKKFLISKGVDKARITTEGAGESSPIATNKTVEGRSLNRRVEIYAYGAKKQVEDEPSYKEEYVIENRLTDLQRTLGMLDALRAMRRDNSDGNISRQYYKPGFYSIAERDKVVRDLYAKSLETLLLPRVATQIEKELLLNLSDKVTTQNNLKAYLMLADEKHRNKEFLEHYMLNRWGDELGDEEIRRLNRHFDALLSIKFKPVKLHLKSIHRARRTLLAHAGIAGVIYKDFVEEGRRQGLHDFQFLEILDSYPNALTGTEYRIPGLYTKDGYEKIILVHAKSIIKRYMTRGWILGEEGDESKQELSRIYEKVLSLYFTDYRRYWTKAMAQLGIPSYTSSSDLSRQLELLSSSISPVTLVLRAFKENTYLLTPKERANAAMKRKRELGVTGAEIGGTIGSKLDRLQRLGTKGMQEFASDKMVYDLRTVFKPYHDLLDEHNKPSRKFQIVLRHVEKVYQQMLEIDTASDPQQIAFGIVQKKSTSAHKTFALQSSLLPTKFLALYNKALGQSWKFVAHMAGGQLNKTYNDEIWTFYTERIRGKFPLNLHARSEVSVDDFKAFFQKDGMLDKFYQKYVLPFVKIDPKTGKYTIKTVDGAKVKIDKKMIASMQAAKKVQRLFFQSDGSLQLKATIRPSGMSDVLGAMSILNGEQELMFERKGKVESKYFACPPPYPDSPSKLTFFDSSGARIAIVNAEGNWSLLRLFVKMHRKILSPSRMIVSYRKGDAGGAFEVSGAQFVTLFSRKNPLSHFVLRHP